MARWLRKYDRTSYFALQTVRSMHHERWKSHATDILSFVGHRHPVDPMAKYSSRVNELRLLQREFERTGNYPAKCYGDVKPVDNESYNLTLLLSFICNNHRFEILNELQQFLKLDSNGPRKLLSVGYGTGYELRVAREILPDWEIEAFDTSDASFAYATDLLGFFKCRPVSLCRELFPLETTENLERYRSAFGKVVLCELLEHLEQPAKALQNLNYVLHESGHAYLTMAINIAQEDHVFLCRSAKEFREQIVGSGLEIVKEILTPAVMLPFDEAAREKNFQKGNYVCVVRKGCK
jgi:SAM-dependent methyltransferase